LVVEQGLLGLVEEEAGIDLLVEAEEGLVRVVCPDARSTQSPSRAVATKIALMTVRSA
jgi:hypothetical protein